MSATAARPYLSVYDSEIYAPTAYKSGDSWSDFRSASVTARISPRSLLPPSLLALAGAAPAQPPRIAVLEHNYGAGPVLARIRDAVPGSVEYVTEFSEGMKPVAYGKIRDLDGNGYEELVVVSRFPARPKCATAWTAGCCLPSSSAPVATRLLRPSRNRMAKRPGSRSWCEIRITIASWCRPGR